MARTITSKLFCCTTYSVTSCGIFTNSALVTSLRGESSSLLNPTQQASKVERGMSSVSHHVSHQKEHGGWIIGGWILKQTISYRAVYIIERNLYVIYSSQKINSYSVMKFPRAIADDRILECPRNEENDPRYSSNTQVGS